MDLLYFFISFAYINISSCIYNIDIHSPWFNGQHRGLRIGMGRHTGLTPATDLHNLRFVSVFSSVSQCLSTSRMLRWYFNKGPDSYLPSPRSRKNHRQGMSSHRLDGLRKHENWWEQDVTLPLSVYKWIDIYISGILGYIKVFFRVHVSFPWQHNTEHNFRL